MLVIGKGLQRSEVNDFLFGDYVTTNIIYGYATTNTIYSVLMISLH